MTSESSPLDLLPAWFVGWLAISIVFVSLPVWLVSRRLLHNHPEARVIRWAPWLASVLPLLSLAGPFSLVLRAYWDAGNWPTDHEWTFEGDRAYLSSPVPSDYPLHGFVAFLLYVVAGWGAFIASGPLFLAYWRTRALDWRAPLVFATSYALFLAWIALDPGDVRWWFAD